MGFCHCHKEVHVINDSVVIQNYFVYFEMDLHCCFLQEVYQFMKEDTYVTSTVIGYLKDR